MARWMIVKTTGEWMPYDDNIYSASPATFKTVERDPLYCRQKGTGKLFAFSPYMAERNDMETLDEIPEELMHKNEMKAATKNSVIPEDESLEAMEFQELKSLLKGHYTGTPNKETLIALAKELRDSQ